MMFFLPGSPVEVYTIEQAVYIHTLSVDSSLNVLKGGYFSPIEISVCFLAFMTFENGLFYT